MQDATPESTATQVTNEEFFARLRREVLEDYVDAHRSIISEGIRRYGDHYPRRIPDSFRMERIVFGPVSSGEWDIFCVEWPFCCPVEVRHLYEADATVDPRYTYTPPKCYVTFEEANSEATIDLALLEGQLWSDQRRIEDAITHIKDTIEEIEQLRAKVTLLEEIKAS